MAGKSFHKVKQVSQTKNKSTAKSKVKIKKDTLRTLLENEMDQVVGGCGFNKV